MSQDVADAMTVLLRNSPQLSSMEHATVAMTAASIVMAAVAIAIGLFAVGGIVTSVFSARKIAQRQVDHVVDDRMKLLREDLPALVQAVMDDYILRAKHNLMPVGDERVDRATSGERRDEY
ncbi:hypothetical protein GCM10011505_30030 [Tistrella bauzanensis]|uniref:Uncharacterized protein n=1 Tax=Tistrella bauzanensis TaxID=657419 RepID=A0ABQ1INX7_9PROT|nr:hypothetical protein [Tistrella bauzanensis]GGB46895.1 hypothetical protein GCM10011505_30030 [Tistrella bauzanensis]